MEDDKISHMYSYDPVLACWWLNLRLKQISTLWVWNHWGTENQRTKTIKIRFSRACIEGLSQYIKDKEGMLVKKNFEEVTIRS